MQRPDLLYITEMRDACRRILEVVGERTSDEVRRAPDARDALLWNFTVLGEATGRVSEETRGMHTEVPWRRPIDLRNRIVHGYWSIDLDVLVTTAHRDISALLEALEEMLGRGDE